MPNNIIITPGNREISFQDGSNPARKLTITGSNLSYESTISASNFYTHNSSGRFYGSASYAATASYAAIYYSGSVVSSSYAVTASYALNGGGGGTNLVTGSTYPITSSYSINAISASYIPTSANITASLAEDSISSSYAETAKSASYALTASYALNGGGGGHNVVLVTGSIATQTILYDVVTGQENVISSVGGAIDLSLNKWSVSVLEEWDDVSGDPYYASCSLLLHCNGTDNSISFSDSGPNSLTVTSNGGAKIVSAINKFGSGSGFFDGVNDYLSVPNSVGFNFGTGDFTIECWIRSSDVSAARQRGFFQTSTSPIGLATYFNTGIAIIQGANASGGPLNGGLCANVAGVNVGSNAASITANTWHHIALVRLSGTSSLYVDGTSIASVITPGNCSGTYAAVGGYYNTSFLHSGYIDELRILKGVARYTGSFTPPTTEFENIAYTQYTTNYIATVGGLNDTGSDYGVQKINNSSLKIRKMSNTSQPVSGSQALSNTVDRVYVNVLDYTNVTSASNSTSASYALTSSYAGLSQTASYVNLARSASYVSLAKSASYVNLARSASYYSGNVATASYSPSSGNSISASYALTASYALNGGGGGHNVVLVTGSIATQTILYDVVTGQENTITGIDLSLNKWSVSVLEEWEYTTGDPYYASCSLLLHCNGTNNSTTFSDSGPYNLTVTSVGGAKIASAINKFGSGSGFFDGVNDYLSIPDHPGFNFGSGDFTVECWLYPTAHPAVVYLFGQTNASDVAPFVIALSNGRPSIAASTNGSTWIVNATLATPLTLNAWTHLAAVRYGNKWSVYVNGVENVVAPSTSGTLYDSVNGLGIGADGPGAGVVSYYYKGYIDEFRVLKGVARYTGSFTPPTSEFDNIAYTQTLTNYVATVGGLNDTGSDYGVQKINNSSLKIRKMSDTSQPVSGSQPLSSTVDRVYVNVLDYTNVTSASNSTSASYALTASYASNAGSFLTTGSTYPITASWSNNSVTSSYVITSQTASYYGGNVISSSYSLSSSYAPTNTNITASWSSNAISSSYALTASYVSGGGGGHNVVLVTGSIATQTILYDVVTGQENIITGIDLSLNKWSVSVLEEWEYTTGDPYYASCSLLLHCNGTNNSTTFSDSGPNNLTVTSVGGTKIASAIYKFGSGSAFFDGVNDYISVQDNAGLNFGSGDFTIEYWEYRTSTATQSPILSRNTAVYTPYMVGWRDSAVGPNLALYMSSTGTNWNVASNVSMGSVVFNAWTHYAVTRQGNTFRTFQNGTLISTFTSAASFPAVSGPLQIGRYDTVYYFKGGYLDELRILKGVARYTGSFTPPTAEFENIAYTQNLTNYMATVGGLNDTGSDYGVQKINNSSLKIRKMSNTSQPVSGSQPLSNTVDRVYVNVLDYTNVTSASNSTSASYALTSSYYGGSVETASFASNSVSSSYALTSSYTPIYLLEAYASETYTLPGSFTEDPCRYSYISNTVNVSSSWFNTSTYTFTPQKAGYWEITATYDVYRNAEASMVIKKNTNIVASAGSFNSVAQQITKIVYLNGSTDYIKIFNYGGAALSRSQYDARSWFQARWVGE